MIKRETGLFGDSMDRRQVLRRALWTSLGGAIAYNELALGPSVQSLFNRLMLQAAGRTLDARALLAEAARGGPAAFRWGAASALADTLGAQPWSVVHIKVVNHVSTPLVFRLGPEGEDKVTTTNSSDQDVAGQPGVKEPFIFSKFSSADCRKNLVDLGLGKLSPLGLGLNGLTESTETYGKKFRMNQWFASILHNPNTAQASSFYPQGALAGTGIFDHNAVGLQCSLGLGQTNGGNHSLRNLKVGKDLPDLGFYVSKKGIITSPLGISAFMMGNSYDSAAEGAYRTNVVMSSFGDADGAAVQGVSVSTHADSILQALTEENRGYFDSRVEKDNLTLTFDKLVASDPALRRAMESSRDLFSKNILSELKTIASLEETYVFPRTVEGIQSAVAVGALQNTGGGRPEGTTGGFTFKNATSASLEFLSQIQYSAKLLQIQGRPVQNFSLFLNMQDVDGGTIDSASFNDNIPSNKLAIKCLSYVEGMRQLAIGLNVLSQVIKQSGNLLVVVTSEGGRKNDMTDSTVSFGFVMGPKADVPTALHANLEEIMDSSGLQVKDPGAPAGIHKQSSSSLFDSLGRGIGGNAKVGHMQAGAIRLLAEKLAPSLSLTDLGSYIKIK